MTREVDLEAAGADMYELITELYPICRSITGEGVRRTLGILQTRIDLAAHQVRTGTKVFDWSVPKEWNVRAAWIKDAAGETVVDFARSNLHLVSYSTPVRARLTLAELKPHLFSLPEHPDWIPYRTSYYHEAWGFCLPHKQLAELLDDEYEVCVDTTLEDGHLTYGEYFLQGGSDDEVLISCHVCHPSLCNDNLSGIAVSTALARALAKRRLRYSYRFLFIPGTIGSITWLALNEARAARIKHGLVLACVGDAGQLTYKQSRRGDAYIDRIVAHVLKHSGQTYEIAPFSPYGYDERQFCSPGFNLPVGRLSRTPHGQFPEYHTSADNLELVRPEALADSFEKCLEVIDAIEHNRTFVNQNPKCEPQLGRRGLYRTIGGAESRTLELAMLWVLNLSDGTRPLLDIAERANLPFRTVWTAAKSLAEHRLLTEAGETTHGG